MSQSFSLTLLIACLAVFLATAVGESVVHRRHLSWMTESGVAIIVGLAIGFVFFLYEMLTTNDQTQLDAASRRLEFLEFDPVFFSRAAAADHLRVGLQPQPRSSSRTSAASSRSRSPAR